MEKLIIIISAMYLAGLFAFAIISLGLFCKCCKKEFKRGEKEIPERFIRELFFNLFLSVIWPMTIIIALVQIGKYDIEKLIKNKARY